MEPSSGGTIDVRVGSDVLLKRSGTIEGASGRSFVSGTSTEAVHTLVLVWETSLFILLCLKQPSVNTFPGQANYSFLSQIQVCCIILSPSHVGGRWS